MMDNRSFRADVLQLEKLLLNSQSTIPAFILLLLAYIFIIVSNVGLVVLIFCHRSLHQPMYLLFCNMSINDIFGATTVVPRLLSDVSAPTAERHILFVDCAVQAFCVHLHASASHTVLMIMAFDRYVAICKPLRYATVMTDKMVVKLSAAAWGVAAALVSVLLGLSVRLSHCRRVVRHPFCDNASLFKLSCESLLANQVYGLGFSVLLLGSSLGAAAFTYLRIASVCLGGKNAELNGRALQTCASHLAVYVLLMVLAFVIITLHRFPHLSGHTKVASVLGHVLLPALNAAIYGLQIKQLRHKVVALFAPRRVRPAQA